MAYTVCYALLGSMLVALTLIPVLATYLFRKDARAWDNPVLAWGYRGYEAPATLGERISRVDNHCPKMMALHSLFMHSCFAKNWNGSKPWSAF